ncbi:AraC family transcriptional regulator [Halomonas sp. M20]|uniref:AraC family transcriptional regulator n=1 Tax=Halomonas sp. M20 TaxID=2763264 RepID=UPI001D09A8C6|nr:AraC family transcriptional regulator [Halomonas sp. M20]
MIVPRPVVEMRAYPNRVLTDRHDFHQLLLGLSGSVELETDGRGARVVAGVLVPIIAGEQHHYLALRDNDCLALDLPVPWCEALELDVSMIHVPRRLPSALVASASELTAASPTALLSWLNEALSDTGTKVTAPRLRLIQLISIVEADLAHPWRVNEMAVCCHLAEAVFARQFRALTGQTPHTWLITRRLDRARHLMSESTASMTEIALTCGFADAAHFSRTFRRQYGCAPKEWRGNARFMEKSRAHEEL